MKKTTTKKAVLSRVLTASALLMLTAAPVVSSVVSTVTVSAATSNAVADDTSARSITITKYQAKNLNDHGEAGDGTSQTVTNTPLKGVKFKLQRVLPKDGGSQLVDPTQQKEGVDYTIDTSFTEQVGTTDENGQIKWDLGTGKANDGIYIITEVDDSGATDPTTGKPVTVTTPANPFFVYVPQTSRGDNSSLIYDVQAQPKNVVEDDLNPIKTINGEPGGSVVAGNTFQWELTTGIPSGLYETAKDDTNIPVVDGSGNQLYTDTNGKDEAYVTIKAGDALYFDGKGGPYYDASGKQVTPPAQSNFSMTDDLNAGLNYKGATVWVHNATGWVQLNAADYTVNYDEGTHKFVMDLTAQGIKEVGSGSITDVDGKTVAGPFDQISTHIETTVNEGFDGNIPNKFEVKYQTPGSKPGTEVPPTEPYYYNGGFDILKEDSKTQAELAGAEFKIATSEENAKAGIFLATDGKSYGPTDTLPSGVSYLNSTSDDKGHAAFDGLPLIWTDGNGNNAVDIDPSTGLPINGDKIQQDYWVVETKAPSGYELLKDPVHVLVDLATQDDKTIELTVDNDKSTKLPFTGGAGTGIMITVALGAIGLGTAFVVMDKKRKSNEA